MEIDIKKIMGKVPETSFEAVDQMNKAQQEVLEALHIMQSTIQFWDDVECLKLNKERMAKYFNKFAKDEILSN